MNTVEGFLNRFSGSIEILVRIIHVHPEHGGSSCFHLNLNFNFSLVAGSLVSPCRLRALAIFHSDADVCS